MNNILKYSILDFKKKKKVTLVQQEYQLENLGGCSTRRPGVQPLAITCANYQGMAWNMAGVCDTALAAGNSGSTASPDGLQQEHDCGGMVEQGCDAGGESWGCKAEGTS